MLENAWKTPDKTLDLNIRVFWRQIRRVAGRESGSPSFWKVPGLPRKFPTLPRKFLGDLPGSSLTVELNSNPGVPRKFPRLPRKFPGLPRKFPGLPWRSAPFSGKPDTLSWLAKTFSEYLGNEKCARSFFAQTFWTPPGVRDIPAKFHGHPGFLSSKPKEDKVWGRARSFRPPPLRVEDPHPTGWSPDPKTESLCSLNFLWVFSGPFHSTRRQVHDPKHTTPRY